MSILSTIFGRTAAEPINAIGNILDGLFTSKEEVLSKEIILTRLAQQPNLIQVELNKVEAQHRSLLVAGWRPFIGWVCGLGLFNMFLVNPWFQWVMQDPGPQLPKDIIMELVLALLGLGTLRTVEKLQGRAK